MSEGKFDSHRRLCPDGACIGVIGDDGRCRVCGRAATGGGANDAAPAGFVAAPSEDARDDDDEADDGDAEQSRRGDTDADARTAAPAGAGFDPNRRLCRMAAASASSAPMVFARPADRKLIKLHAWPRSR